MDYAKCIEFYINRKYSPNEVVVKLYADGSLEGIDWNILEIQKPTIEQLAEIWKNNNLTIIRQDRLNNLKRNYINLIIDTDNDFIMYLKRTEAGIATNDDKIKSDQAVETYKTITEKYKMVKANINSATTISEIESILIDL